MLPNVFAISRLKMSRFSSIFLNEGTIFLVPLGVIPVNVVSPHVVESFCPFRDSWE